MPIIRSLSTAVAAVVVAVLLVVVGPDRTSNKAERLMHLVG
jgi:uncharacterized membrane protein YccC